MYENTIREINEKGLEFERFYVEACKDSAKRGLYNVVYVEKEKDLYIEMKSTIIGQRELDLQGKEKDTRVRYFLIYVKFSPVTEIKEKPKQYKFLADRMADKDGDKVVKDYLDFYMGNMGDLIGCVVTKKEAFEIVKNLYLKKLDEFQFEENKKKASILQKPLAFEIKSLDNLNIEMDGQLNFA